MKRCTRTKSRRKREVITESLEDDNLYNFIELDNKEVSDNYATSMSLLGEISTDFEEMEKIAYAHCVAESDSANARKVNGAMVSIAVMAIKKACQTRK